MNFIERIEELRKQQREIKGQIEGLLDGLQSDEWVFSLDTYYKEARIEARKYGDERRSGASFVVKGDRVKLRSAGEYWDDWNDAEDILNDWLCQDFSQ